MGAICPEKKILGLVRRQSISLILEEGDLIKQSSLPIRKVRIIPYHGGLGDGRT